MHDLAERDTSDVADAMVNIIAADGSRRSAGGVELTGVEPATS